MNQNERRFYEDIHKLVTIQKEILAELKKMNTSKDEIRNMVEDDLYEFFSENEEEEK